MAFSPLVGQKDPLPTMGTAAAAIHATRLVSQKDPYPFMTPAFAPTSGPLNSLPIKPLPGSGGGVGGGTIGYPI